MSAVKDITHIERANLPWHSERLTECGLDAEIHPTWTRAEVTERAHEWGVQRLSFSVCMTCWGTFERHSSWEDDPASCMVRHAMGQTLKWGGRTPEKIAFANELRALAALAERHRDEFDALCRDLGDVVDLRARAASRRAVP